MKIEKNEILKIIINIYFSLLRSTKKHKTVFDVWIEFDVKVGWG